MPYAEGRTYYDADSHLMELSDWLVRYADPHLRERIRPLQLGAAGALAAQSVADAEARRGDRAEQFPRLRGGCIEQGAMWVVPWLQRLDIAQESFRRTEPALALPLKASQYIRRHVKFTPFATEPVGWMIEQAGPDLFLFSTDYPHPEGTRDPIKRFEAAMPGISEDAKEQFYSRNFAEMMGIAA